MWCGGIGLCVMHMRREGGPTSANREDRSAKGERKRSSKPKRNYSTRVHHIRVRPEEEVIMRVAAEERGLDSPAIFIRLAALYMAGAPIGQEAEALGIPFGARLLDGAANNVRQLQRAARRNRGYEMTNKDRLMMLNLHDVLTRLLESFERYRRVTQGRNKVLGNSELPEASTYSLDRRDHE